MLDIEKSLEQIGTFGIWHAWVYFWIFYVVCFGASVQVAIIFMQDIPDFICENPLTTLTNWTFDEIRSVSTPKQDVGHDFNGCKYYLRNYSQVANLSFTDAQPLLKNQTTDTHSCDTGPYTWRITQMKLTIVNQWTMVCDSAVQVSNTATVYMVGFFMGCLLASFLADKFGRKKVSIIAGTLGGITGVCNPFIPNLYGFFVVRAFLAFFMNLVSPSLYVLALELCTDAVRKPMGAMYFIAYSIGYTLLAGVAYLTKDWRTMHAAVSAPLLIIPLFYWFIPESPRWLVSQGREKEAIKVLNQAARWNKRKIHIQEDDLQPKIELKEEISSKQPSDETSPESTNFFVVFKYWRLALRTLNIFFNWTANGFVYFGISYLITSFSGSVFVNNAIAGALETPGYLLSYPMLWWARKKSVAVLFLVAGIACLVYLAVPDDVSWAQLLLAFVGKVAITASFGLIYLVTSELYPTSIRGASVALGSMTARIGGMAAPYVVLIVQKNDSLMWVAMSIFGAVALVTGVLTFFLPESQNQPLPETLDEAIHYPPKNKNKEKA